MNFIEEIKSRILLGDGAMGTYLLARGVSPGQNFEALCLTDPELIRTVHREYAAAGADLIETNTFGANRIRLRPAGYGRQAAKINRAAAELARSAAGEAVLVAGAVGMIPAPDREPPAPGSPVGEELLEAYREQIAALAEGGVDLIILETFEEWENLSLALRAAREASPLPVVAQMAHSNRGISIFGATAEECCRRALDSGAAVFGSNCGGGFASVEAVLRGAARVEGTPLSAFPNAGVPELVQGRIIYPSGPEYFAGKCLELIELGARLIGGCCGTTPRHIRALRRSLDARTSPPARPRERPAAAPPPPPPLRLSVEGGFLAGLRGDRLPIIVEIDPPTSPDLERVVEGAVAVKNAGADAVSMAENPLAALRVSPFAAGAEVRRRAGIQVIPHLTARDHSVLGLQSLLLGAAVSGLEAVLAVTGDPAGKGDGTGERGVFAVNSVHLAGMAEQLNRGHLLSGADLACPTDLSIGAAFNANAANLPAEADRLRKKTAAGARFAMTQPIFSAARAREVISACEGIGVRIFIGVYPLLSLRNADFMTNEVPGIAIPEEVRKRIQEAGDRAAQRRAGLEIAWELIEEIRGEIDGLYLISPLNLWSLPRELVQRVRAAEKN